MCISLFSPTVNTLKVYFPSCHKMELVSLKVAQLYINKSVLNLTFKIRKGWVKNKLSPL